MLKYHAFCDSDMQPPFAVNALHIPDAGIYSFILTLIYITFPCHYNMWPKAYLHHKMCMLLSSSHFIAKLWFSEIYSSYGRIQASERQVNDQIKTIVLYIFAVRIMVVRDKYNDGKSQEPTLIINRRNNPNKTLNTNNTRQGQNESQALNNRNTRR